MAILKQYLRPAASSRGITTEMDKSNKASEFRMLRVIAAAGGAVIGGVVLAQQIAGSPAGPNKSHSRAAELVAGHWK